MDNTAQLVQACKIWCGVYDGTTLLIDWNKQGQNQGSILLMI